MKKSIDDHLNEIVEDYNRLWDGIEEDTDIIETLLGQIRIMKEELSPKEFAGRIEKHCEDIKAMCQSIDRRMLDIEWNIRLLTGDKELK
ncbi:MAG TPA: hypothetical protein VLS45_08330 [Methylomicrobium sp.]|nr:hypothetical protein [Methylomicrobium sp.]